MGGEPQTGRLRPLEGQRPMRQAISLRWPWLPPSSLLLWSSCIHWLAACHFYFSCCLRPACWHSCLDFKRQVSIFICKISMKFLEGLSNSFWSDHTAITNLQGGGGGTNWESNDDTYTLPRGEQMAGGRLLWDTGSSAWYSDTLRGEVGRGRQAQDGGNIYIYVCVCIIMADSHCCTAETNTTL